MYYYLEQEDNDLSESGDNWIVEYLNVSLPATENFHGTTITTGICKVQVDGPLRLNKHGFEGDGVADLKHHGGEDKAVCVYSLKHYPYWESALGIKLPSAAFGENLSVTLITEEEVCIGDVFSLGTARLQVSQPRQPCKTLAARYGRNDLLKMVVDTGFTGFYFRVLQEGLAAPGQKLLLEDRSHPDISVAYANHVFHHDRKNKAALEKILAVSALSASWQVSFRELIDKPV
ncbi:MAG: MOSC domain-containing protein [Nitrospirae bacterium]|nr:MOSC domain-containing protein [Nitrospirota bacterium]